MQDLFSNNDFGIQIITFWKTFLFLYYVLRLYLLKKTVKNKIKINRFTIDLAIVKVD